MLKPATLFPSQSSWCVWIEPGRVSRHGDSVAELARIIQRDGDTALVALPHRGDGAAGNRRVPFAELHDATELTVAEQVERRELARDLKVLVNPKRSKKYRRWAELTARDGFALLVAAELAQLGRSAPQRVAA